MKVAAADRLGCFPLPTVAGSEAVTRYGFHTFGQAKGCARQFHALSVERKLILPAVVATTSNARGKLFGHGDARTCRGNPRPHQWLWNRILTTLRWLPHSAAPPILAVDRRVCFMRSVKLGLMAAGIGMAVNIVLAIVKIVTGVVGNSYALVADGIESTSDIVSSLVVWTGLKISSLPPDDDHPYGHGKAESMAGIVVALALLAAAVFIAVQSLREIITPHHAPAWYTLLVLVLVIGTKEALYRFVLKVGDELTSTAVKGDVSPLRSSAARVTRAQTTGRHCSLARSSSSTAIEFFTPRWVRSWMRQCPTRCKKKYVRSPLRCRAWCGLRNAGPARAGWGCLWKSM